MEHVTFDYEREARIGLPEAVFSENKPFDVLLSLLKKFAEPDATPILFTRLAESVWQKVDADLQSAYNYDPISQTAFAKQCTRSVFGSAAVVAAGSADAAVTWEAARTLEYLGIRHEVYEDCGVAGLWRLQKKLPEISKHDVIIVVAGFEGALTTILGGLSSKPLIGVPTPIGYGVCEGGKTALHGMLASCAPGITVVNIGNGYGAACAATRILNMLSAYMNK